VIWPSVARSGPRDGHQNDADQLQPAPAAVRSHPQERVFVEIGAQREEAEDEELTEQLARIPNLTEALAEAPPELQRQVFQAFELQILYDKAERRIEISATVSQAVANAFENSKALPKVGFQVVPRDIAGARYVSRYDPTRWLR